LHHGSHALGKLNTTSHPVLWTPQAYLLLLQYSGSPGHSTSSEYYYTSLKAEIA